MSEQVPDLESQAGPGSWQCAICGAINDDARDVCYRCNDGQTYLSEDATPEPPTTKTGGDDDVDHPSISEALRLIHGDREEGVAD